ncbi:MAG: WD40 repeat domain-containing serine/threonine protein kinase [Isosphaeraceae bacterium]
MARLSDEVSNPNPAGFDPHAVTDPDHDAIADLDRAGGADLDECAVTELDRGAVTELDPDAAVGPVLPPGLEATSIEEPSESAGGRDGGRLPQIEGYEILGVLGAGGMGIVYRARQPRLDRLVALKMIRAGDGARPDDLDRFEAEARAVAAIDHPNIIKIFAIGERDGLPYFSLEFLEGGSLAQRIDGKPQPVEESARIVEALARAMSVAHRRGIVHRDIKPANVLFAADGTPKIADFGLVKRLEEDSARTGAGSILGSPSYMAPEQTTGAERAGPAADQYALGVTLYEMLTGRPPFRGPSILDTLDLVRNAEPVPPSRLLPRLPRDLETICLKALQKDPSRRYPDAAAMAEDLRRFLAREPIVARPVAAPERAWRWCRRHPAEAILLGAVAASLVLGMAGTSYFAIQALHREQEARANARQAQDEKARSDLRWYAAETTLAQKDWEEGEIVSLERRLDILEPRPAGAPDLRGFEWYHLRRLCRLDQRALPGHLAPVRGVAISPDGQRLASASGTFGQPGEVKIWDMATGRELHRLGGLRDLASCVAFSPDGRCLAAANGGVHTPGEIVVWDAVEGRERLRLAAHDVPVRSLAFSPDGRQIASLGGGVSATGIYLPGEVKIWDAVSGKPGARIAGEQAPDWINTSSGLAFGPAATGSRRRLAFADGHTVRVCDPDTGEELFRLGKHAYLVNSVACSPEGRHLALAGSDGTVKVWDVETRAEILSLHQEHGVASLAFGLDGRRLAAAAGNGIVKVWDITDPGKALELHGHRDTVGCVAFSPDGWRLASGGGDGIVKIWDATAPAEAVTLAGVFGNVGDMALDPAGRRAAIAGSSFVHIVDTVTGVEIFKLAGHVDTPMGVAFRPDGRRLASVSMDRTVRLWDAASGSEVFCLRGHDAPVLSVAFSPDGRRLASIARGPAAGGRAVPSEVILWDSRQGQMIRRLTLPGEPGGRSRSAGVTFSLDGTRLAASAGRTVRVWNPADGQEIFTRSGLAAPITGVAFSPDGRRLAAATRDGTVTVWDAATGAVGLNLRGLAGAVDGLTYSPDGRRIVTAVGGTNRGGERRFAEVTLWDAVTGQEILTLRGPPAQQPRVAFDQGGRRLAVSTDLGATIWEGIPLDSELADDRQAASLVRFLFDRLPTAEAISARVRDYPVGDAVRQRALALVEPFWRERVRRDAEAAVRSRFRMALLQHEVLASLRADRSLSEPVRQEALALAERCVGFPKVLEQASRAVVARPDAEPAAYRLALQRAEVACRLLPFEGSYHTTLGMAQYRLGKYPEALATLTHADDLNRAALGGPVPADLAFLAMTRYQMHEAAQAQAALTELRETVARSQWARNAEAQRLLKEAEVLLAGREARPEK